MIKFTTKLFLILAATLLPTGVWGDNVINVTQASNFGETTTDANGTYYTLQNEKTYILQNDIVLEGYLHAYNITVTIDLNGHTLRRNLGSPISNGYIIYNSGNSANMTIKDSYGGGTITGGKNNPYGGGICNYGGTMTIEGGTVTGNTATDDGGGIANFGTLTISGGIIQNNTATDDGGGIYNNGPLYLEGGTITGNTASSKGGGIYNIGDMYMKGSPTVTNNTGGGNTDNLDLVTNTITIIGALSGTSQVGVRRDNAGSFTRASYSYEPSETDYQIFVSDDSNYVIGKSSTDNNAKLQTYWDALQDKITAAQEATGDDKIVTLDQDYTAISGDSPLEISGTVTLDLNGHTINRGLGSSATANGNVITVTSAGNLTIKDTSTGGTITGGFNSGNGGGIINQGILAIEGGSITGNKSTGNGAGIYHTGTSLTMKGAPTITNNTKSSAANNVYLTTGKTIAIGTGGLTTGASIGVTLQSVKGTFTTGATSALSTYFSSDDGRLNVVDDSDGKNARLQTPWDALQTLLDGGGMVTLTQTYNAISGLDGPLVVNNNVTLDLATFDINRNLTSAATNGYVIKVESGKTLTIQGTTGQIKGGYNNNNGGGIYNAGTVDLQGGAITGNKVTSNYNGAGIYNAGTLKMQGAPQVTSNTIGTSTPSNIYLPTTNKITIEADLTGSAGNIGVTMQLLKGTFTTGSSTADNVAKFSSDDTRLQVAADGNNAKLQTEWDFLQNQLNAGDYTLTKSYEAIPNIDGPLTVNNDVTFDLATYTIDRKLTSAIENGYVIKVESGKTLTITGSGTIKGGYNTENGGGIYNAGTLHLNGGNVTGNYVSLEKNGAGIYNEGTLTLAGSANVNNNKIGGSSGTKNNVYLLTSQTIDITAALTGTTGITHADGHAVFTTSLSGRGTANYFAADINGYGIGLDASGNAIVGLSYTITKSSPSYGSIAVKSSAVEGEVVNVTLTPSTNYTTTSLIYSYNSTEHPVSFPRESDTFTMPACPVTVSATFAIGGYCGEPGVNGGNDVKWYINSNTLYIIADGNKAMNSYAQNDVPWKNSSFTAVTLDDDLTSISPYAFYGKSISTINIPASVTSIGTFAFGNCTSLTAITVDGSNPNFMNNSSDGVLYTKSAGNPTNLVCYPAGKMDGEYTLPETVSAITEGAFAYNTYLTTISVASETYFKAPEGVLYNSGLTELYYYPSQKEGDSYTIASTVTNIMPYAFHSNRNVEKLYVLAESPLTAGGTAMFGNSFHNFRIWVKEGHGDYYKAAAYWIEYARQIYEMTLTSPVITLTSNKDEYDYNGSAASPPAVATVKPSVVSVTVAGVALRPEDYTVSWTNNYTARTGTVTISPFGEFSGSNASIDFDITRKIVISGATGHYSTYFNSDAVPLVTPSGLQANKVTVVNFESGTTTIEAIGYLPASTPVLLYASSGNCNGTYHLKATTGDVPGDCSPNYIGKGEGDARDYESLMFGKTAIYVLRGDKFYRAYSGTLPANRCYIAKPTAGARAIPDYLEIGEGDGTTNVISIENGELKIENDKYYDLSGRRVLYPTKGGVYIYNGKKIVIK